MTPVTEGTVLWAPTRAQTEASELARSMRWLADHAIAEVPRTLTGKRMELPARKLLLGAPLEKVASADAMANPQSLAFFLELAKELDAPAA